jgi:two-component system response regulator
MIVDDAPDQVELMKTVFNMVDPSLQITAVNDGDAALNLLRTSKRPRVVLLDLRMPKMSGLEVLQHIKSDPNLKTIPVCAFSSSDDPKDVRDAYTHGASFYFRKPSGIDQIVKFAEHFRSLWFDFASQSK